MSRREQIVSGCTLLALIAVGTFFDLSISDALYRPAGAFGKVFDIIGEFPCYALAALAFALLGTADSRHNCGLSFSKLFSFFFSTVAFAVVFHHLGWQQAYAIFPGLALAGFLYPAARSMQKSFDPIALRRVSIIIVLTVFIEVILVQGLKFLWGRPRFYAVLMDPSLYTPWYRIRGLARSDAFKSFPSAHASDAAVMICLTLFEPITPLSGKKRALLHIAAYAFTLSVMLSRIVIGAHFLSDVAFGAGITLIAFFMARQIAKRFKHRLTGGDTV